MFKHAATALAVLVALGGCSSSDQPASAPAGANGQAAPAAAPDQPDNVIKGVISLREPMQINPGAKLEIQLIDVTMPDLVLAKSSEVVNGQPPYDFTLTFNPDNIDRSRTYVVNVLLFDGDRRFVPALQSPVLTGDNGRNVQVVLNSEATPGEKLKTAYSKLQTHIGGMRRVQDSYLKDDSSVAWDGFVEEGNVRFMRVTVDKDEGGRSEIKYAFADNQPLMVVRVADRVTTRVGWDKDGKVIVNEKSGGGSVSEDEIASLHADAMKMLQLGQAQAAKKRK
ncbi:MAG: YbaY family lipoprotein [Dokdonella sp.]